MGESINVRKAHDHYDADHHEEDQRGTQFFLDSHHIGIVVAQSSRGVFVRKGWGTITRTEDLSKVVYYSTIELK